MTNSFRHTAALVVLLAWPMDAVAQSAHDHEHASMPHDMAAMSSPATNGIGSAAPPPVPADHAADALFPLQRMAAARRELLGEDRITFSQILVDRLELQPAGRGTGYAWQGEASFGTDRDRAVVATEGEGRIGRKIVEAELQAKWRHAIGPWFDAEIGLRHDLQPGPSRSYLVLGVEGIAPYWIDTEAQLFVSNKGDVHARLQAGLDQRITQRIVLRPEAEIDIALQDVPELGITSRIPEWSLGFRLRYEVTPRFAPYIGLDLRRDAPATPSRAAGQRDRDGMNLLIGMRTWF